MLLALAHVIENEVEAAYRRGEPVRQAPQDDAGAADYLDSVPAACRGCSQWPATCLLDEVCRDAAVQMRMPYPYAVVAGDMGVVAMEIRILAKRLLESPVRHH
jgi:hypothetical protein